jgi:hypothetical protein
MNLYHSVRQETLIVVLAIAALAVILPPDAVGADLRLPPNAQRRLYFATISNSAGTDFWSSTLITATAL